MAYKILIVEDQKSSREMLASFLEEQGYSVTAVDNAEDALELFSKVGFSCALLDIRLPGIDGVELLTELRKIDPEFNAIFMTAFGNVESAVKGMGAGAFDYVQKPVNLKKLLELVKKATIKWETVSESESVKVTLSHDLPEGIIADSPCMHDVLSLVARVATTDVPVLITGPSGSGKEIVAQALHQASNRTAKKFVALNCAALPDTLVEAELFGYEPGAFSGASQRKRGLAEIVDGGTLFLDEIGEFPIALQAKLLRMIEGSGFYRIGGTELLTPDIRIVAATNRDLKEMSESKEFREDLYFRLKGIEINVPPLSKRPEDIISLADMFLNKYSHKYERNITGFTTNARNAMLRYNWPGNVRELMHTIESAVVLSRDSVLDLQTLRLPITEEELEESTTYNKPTDINNVRTLADIEKEHIASVLELCNGNISKASALLGIHRNTLSSKVKEYGLS